MEIRWNMFLTFISQAAWLLQFNDSKNNKWRFTYKFLLRNLAIFRSSIDVVLLDVRNFISHFSKISEEKPRKTISLRQFSKQSSIVFFQIPAEHSFD